MRNDIQGVPGSIDLGNNDAVIADTEGLDPYGFTGLYL